MALTGQSDSFYLSDTIGPVDEIEIDASVLETDYGLGSDESEGVFDIDKNTNNTLIQQNTENKSNERGNRSDVAKKENNYHSQNNQNNDNNDRQKNNLQQQRRQQEQKQRIINKKQVKNDNQSQNSQHSPSLSVITNDKIGTINDAQSIEDNHYYSGRRNNYDGFTAVGNIDGYKGTHNTQAKESNLTYAWLDDTLDSKKLSLHSCSKVSVLMNITAPINCENGYENHTINNQQCVFPVFDSNGSDSSKASKQKFVIVNPLAFGKFIPSKVTMETAKLVAKVANISSEDWARTFRFHQIFWPKIFINNDENSNSTSSKSNFSSLSRWAQAMANDVSNFQISKGNKLDEIHRIVIGKDQASSSLTTAMDINEIKSNRQPTSFRNLFGNFSNCDTKNEKVATSYYHDNLTDAKQILNQFGILGLFCHHLFTTLSEYAVCTISILQVTDDDTLIDLLALSKSSISNTKRSNTSRNNNSTNTNNSRVKLRYNNDGRGAIVQGLVNVPLDSISSLGLCLRKAWKNMTTTSTCGSISHFICSIKIWRSAVQRDLQTPYNMCQFADLALDLSSFSSEKIHEISGIRNLPSRKKNNVLASTEGKNRDSILSPQSKRKGIRQGVSAIGSVLRGLSLRETASNSNDITITYRDAAITKLLQRSIEHPNCRVVIMATLSPLCDHYEQSISTIRYLNHISYKQTDRVVKSGDSGENDNNNGKTKNAIRPSRLLEQISDQESLLEKYLCDPRQRLAKVYKPAYKKEDYETMIDDRDLIDRTNYMKIDPGSIENSLKKKLLPTEAAEKEQQLHATNNPFQKVLLNKPTDSFRFEKDGEQVHVGENNSMQGFVVETIGENIPSENEQSNNQSHKHNPSIDFHNASDLKERQKDLKSNNPFQRVIQSNSNDFLNFENSSDKSPVKEKEDNLGIIDKSAVKIFRRPEERSKEKFQNNSATTSNSKKDKGNLSYDYFDLKETKNDLMGCNSDSFTDLDTLELELELRGREYQGQRKQQGGQLVPPQNSNDKHSKIREQQMKLKSFDSKVSHEEVEDLLVRAERSTSTPIRSGFLFDNENDEDNITNGDDGEDSKFFFSDEISTLEGAINQMKTANYDIWKSSTMSVKQLREFQRWQQQELAVIRSEKNTALANVEQLNHRLKDETEASKQVQDSQEKEIDRLRRTIQKLQNDRADVEKIAEEAISAQDSLEEKVLKLDEELQEKNSCAETNEKKHQKLMEANEFLQQNNNDLKKDLYQLRTQANEKEKKILDLQNRTNLAQEEFENLLNFRSKDANTIETLKVDLYRIQNDPEVANLKREILILQQENDESLSNKKGQEHEFLKQLNEKNEYLERYENEVAKLNKEIKTIKESEKSRSISLDVNVKSYEDEIKSLQKELGITIRERNGLHDEIDPLKKQLGIIEKRRDDLQHQNIDLQNQIGKVVRERDESRVKINDLHKQVGFCERKNNQLQDEDSNLQNRIQKAVFERDEMQRMCNGGTSEKKSMTDELYKLKKDVTRRSSEVTKLSIKLEEVITAKEECEEEMDRMKQAICVFQAETKKKVERFVQRNSEATAVLKITVEENKSLSESNKDLKEVLYKLQIEHDRVHSLQCQSLQQESTDQQQPKKEGQSFKQNHEQRSSSYLPENQNSYKYNARPFSSTSRSDVTALIGDDDGDDSLQPIQSPKQLLGYRAEEIAAYLAISAKSSIDRRDEERLQLVSRLMTLENEKTAQASALQARIHVLEDQAAHNSQFHQHSSIVARRIKQPKNPKTEARERTGNMDTENKALRNQQRYYNNDYDYQYGLG